MCTLRQVGLVTVTVQICEGFLRPSPQQLLGDFSWGDRNKCLSTQERAKVTGLKNNPTQVYPHELMSLLR